MKYVISYDITNNRRRARVAALLSGFAYRVQKSVFEGFFSVHELADLISRIEKIIDLSKDSIRAYPLCETCNDKIQVSGTGGRIEKIEYMVL